MSSRSPCPSNRELLLPYLLPYLAYSLPAAAPQGWLGVELDYALRLAGCGAALAWGARRYRSLRGPRSTAVSVALGAAVGAAALPLWVALVGPEARGEAHAWSGTAFALRLIASATAAALAEELLMRGYVLGVAVQWDRAMRAGHPAPLDHVMNGMSLRDLEPGAWTVVAVGASTLLFMAGHPWAAWPAAFTYGLLMAALWIRRGDLVACISAHATTNATLALYVLWSGRWDLW